MLEYLKFAYQFISNAAKERSLAQLFHQQVFYRRTATPFTINLQTLDIKKDPLSELGYRLITLQRDEIEARRWAFLVETRRSNALRHFKRGLSGFALINAENVVVADIWCVLPRSRKSIIHHPDLEMLKLSCSEGDVYAYDMFIANDFRGKKLAVPFHRSLELLLKQAGWQKLYAYYWDDNLPARWMGWMLKCTELPKVRISRLFYFKYTHQ